MVLAALFWSQVREDPSVIAVNRKKVVDYRKHVRSIQQQERGNVIPFIDPELSDGEQFVRSEVLYREALDFGLDKGDVNIKHRLAKKMYMYYLEIERNRLEVSEQDVIKYFKNHKEDYYIHPTVTFAHIFYSVKSRDHALAEELAREKLYYANENKISFAEAIDFGEKFVFQTNYVKKNEEYIAKHFGEAFTESVFKLDKNLTTWFGPFASRHGAHIVMVIDRTYGKYPRLEDVIRRVRKDTERYKLKKMVDARIADLQKAYQVSVDKDLPQALMSKSKPQEKKKAKS